MSTETVQQIRQEPNLKYLGFFQTVVVKVTVMVSSLYGYAKENSGPLKPGVDSVEGTVKTVVGPVYQKLEGKPAELLHFLDKKVDEVLSTMNQYFPQRALNLAKQAPDLAKSVVVEVQKRGFYGTTRDYYVKYEPVAEELSYNVWKTALKMPLVPQVVHLAAPSALYGVGKFNNFVAVLKHNQVPFAAYVPTLPLEKLERAVNMEAEKR